MTVRQALGSGLHAVGLGLWVSGCGPSLRDLIAFCGFPSGEALGYDGRLLPSWGRVGRCTDSQMVSISDATSAARRGSSEITIDSVGACAPSPTPPSPSRVGIPSPAVKFPSEPPPTAASSSFQRSCCAIATALL